jgi:hypothetical protein
MLAKEFLKWLTLRIRDKTARRRKVGEVDKNNSTGIPMIASQNVPLGIERMRKSIRGIRTKADNGGHHKARKRTTPLV